MHEDFEKQHLNQNLVDEPFQNLKSDRLWVAMNIFLKSARLRSRFFMESEMCHCISDLRYFVKIYRGSCWWRGRWGWVCGRWAALAIAARAMAVVVNVPEVIDCVDGEGKSSV